LVDTQRACARPFPLPFLHRQRRARHLRQHRGQLGEPIIATRRRHATPTDHRSRLRPQPPRKPLRFCCCKTLSRKANVLQRYLRQSCGADRVCTGLDRRAEPRPSARRAQRGLVTRRRPMTSLTTACPFGADCRFALISIPGPWERGSARIHTQDPGPVETNWFHSVIWFTGTKAGTISAALNESGAYEIDPSAIGAAASGCTAMHPTAPFPSHCRRSARLPAPGPAVCRNQTARAGHAPYDGRSLFFG